MKEVSLKEEIDRLTQVIAENTYSKKNIHKEIKADIVDGFEAIKPVYQACVDAVTAYQAGSYYKSKNARIDWIRHVDPEEIVLELFMHVMPNVQPASIQKVVGGFAPWFEYDNVFDGAHTAGEILGVCKDANLYSIIEAKHADDGYINIVSNWKPEQEVLDFIEQSRYLNPMLVIPDEWNTNVDGGYITMKSSVILGKSKHHNEKQALDVLNILQEIPWALDERILAMDEVSSKPLDTLEKFDAFEQKSRISSHVHKELLEAGNKFYFRYSFDFRGRMYVSGYYVNFQGDSYRKAQLEFAEKRLIT